MDVSGLELAEKNVIGRGTYATVFKGQLHGTDVAAKLFEAKESFKITQEVIIFYTVGNGSVKRIFQRTFFEAIKLYKTMQMVLNEPKEHEL